MEVEEAFGVTLPDDSPDPVFKAVFTRRGFRLADLAELVYLVQGTGTPERKGWRRARERPTSTPAFPFTQLDGRWDGRAADGKGLFEPLKADGPVRQYRRRIRRHAVRAGPLGGRRDRLRLHPTPPPTSGPGTSPRSTPS